MRHRPARNSAARITPSNWKHDYGPLVYEQPWFAGNFDKTSLTNDVWRPNWFYIHEQNIAPLLIGEWGGRLGQDARQDRWMAALRDLMVENGIHHTFWCLNPNSGDTGGLLRDDWTTWDEMKYNQILKPALWQHNGKFVGLDHQVRLGGANSTTGISLAERYAGGPGPGDTTAPTAPGRPTATDVTATAATLNWAASTDNVGVTAYEVLRATGSGAATVVGTVSGTTYRATNLTASTSYTFTVRARDAAGNVSAASPPLTLTTPAGGGGGDQGCAATYRVVNSWQGGYQAEVTVRNSGTAATTRLDGQLDGASRHHRLVTVERPADHLRLDRDGAQRALQRVTGARHQHHLRVDRQRIGHAGQPHLHCLLTNRPDAYDIRAEVRLGPDVVLSDLTV